MRRAAAADHPASVDAAAPAVGEGLSIDVELRRGDLHLRAALDVAAGEVVAVVGPNGAGKSTLLQVIAGLVAPDAGHIRLGGTPWADTTAEVWCPPADRHVGIVFQDHLLFDHLSVGENIAFGPRARGWGRARAAAEANRWLDLVELSDAGRRRPAQLSGGQRQRVALARALAGHPACLLLDEPLSALDADTRGAVRCQLRRHLGAFAGPVLLVTHEPLEALVLADRLVVLEGGRVTQTGTPAEVARRPRSDWVARLVGINLLAGAVTGSGDVVTVTGGGTIHIADALPAGEALVTVHPRSISLHRERPVGSPRNVWQGTVEEVEIAADRVRVQVGGTPPLVAEVTAGAMAELQLAALADAGGPVWVSFKAADVEAYPR